MKKSVFYLMIFALSLTAFSTPGFAAERSRVTETTPPEEIPAEVRIMLDRLHEIKDMDKSSLNRAEKKALRKEVRAIRSAIRATGNGIYISVGALLVIIIILLLI